MKRILIFLLFLSLKVYGVQAQSDLVFMLNKEGKLIAIPKQVNFEFNIPEFAYKTYTPTSTRIEDELLKAYEPSTPQKRAEFPRDMQVRSGAYRPFYNEYTPMIKRVSPMAFDFEEVEFIPLNENFMLSVSGWQRTWPGAGGITSINPGITWHSGAWAIGGGGYAARYYTPFNISPEFVAGANLHASFQATDWLKLNAWGQYAHYYGNNEQNNPHMLMNPFFYHNSIGSSFEIKLNKDFSVGAGMQYEYNPMRRKWDRQILIFPVFH